MKILVLNNMVPFLRGGAEFLADNLLAQLRTRGHEADLLRIPFAWNPLERIYDEMLACQMLELWNVDRVIALKFPAYLVPHPEKVLWLLHQFRQVYDLWPGSDSESATDLAGHPLRASVQAADNRCFDQARHLYCNSPTTQDRLQKFNDRRGEILRPPLNDPHLFESLEYGNYVFCGGRVNAGKRQHLLVEAMRHVRTPIRLMIVGPPDSPADADRLRELVAKHELHDRVKLTLELAPRQMIADGVNRALACAYIPVDEDSFGYVAMEACHASKAVLTATDSGGVVGLVKSNETGLQVDPTPEAIAAGLDQLWADRAKTEEMGRAAKTHWEKFNVNWDNTIEKLLQ